MRALSVSQLSWRPKLSWAYLKKTYGCGFCLKAWTPLKSTEDLQSSWENSFSRNSASCCQMEDLLMSVRTGWFRVLFKSPVSLLIFCPDVVSTDSAALKPSTIILQHCISAMLLHFCFIWFGVLLLGAHMYNCYIFLMGWHFYQYSVFFLVSSQQFFISSDLSIAISVLL